MNHRRFGSAIASAVVLWSAVHVSGAAQIYRIDPANSRVTIHVGKAGVFSFVAGHSHEVGGPIASVPQSSSSGSP